MHSHGNVSLGSYEPAGAADNSDVLAAAMLQASSLSSALESSHPPAQVKAQSSISGLPAHSLLGPGPE